MSDYQRKHEAMECGLDERHQWTAYKKNQLQPLDVDFKELRMSSVGEPQFFVALYDPSPIAAECYIVFTESESSSSGVVLHSELGFSCYPSPDVQLCYPELRTELNVPEVTMDGIEINNSMVSSEVMNCTAPEDETKPTYELTSEGNEIGEIGVEKVPTVRTSSQDCIVNAIVSHDSSPIREDNYLLVSDDSPKEVQEAHFVKESTESMNTFIKDNKLEDFFPPNDAFVQAIAKNAAALRNNPTTSLGSSENIERLTWLSLYHPVIYCDDSSSMSFYNLWELQHKLAVRIAKIATTIVPEGHGVDLYFVNRRTGFPNKSADAIERTIQVMRPGGSTPLGTTLEQWILKPLVYNVLADPKRRIERPLLFCVITDGEPTEPIDTFKNAIQKCRQRLVLSGYKATTIMFCVNQIGHSQYAKGFLDGLSNDREIQDVLYCTADRLDVEFQKLKQNERELDAWLLKMLTTPIIMRNK